eukprot:7564382-Alexandrium_andersonii.AAC.1
MGPPALGLWRLGLSSPPDCRGAGAVPRAGRLCAGLLARSRHPRAVAAVAHGLTCLCRTLVCSQLGPP